MSRVVQSKSASVKTMRWAGAFYVNLGKSNKRITVEMETGRASAFRAPFANIRGTTRKKRAIIIKKCHNCPQLRGRGVALVGGPSGEPASC